MVASLARPGRNVTGNTFLGPELGPKRLQLLREVVPEVIRMAVLQHPGVYSERTMRNMLTEMDEAAQASGVELQIINSSRPDAFDGAFEAMVNARVSALIILPSPMFYVNYRRLVDSTCSALCASSILRLSSFWAALESEHSRAISMH